MRCLRSSILRRSVLGFCLLSSPTIARAQTVCPEQARADALEEEGQAQRRAHRDAEALERFERSWALCHGARALVRRGLAEWALGRWLEAEAHIVEGLGRRDDPWVVANHEAITRDSLPPVRAHLGSIELSGAAGRGEVWVGNRRVSDWPMTAPVRVLAGESVVMVRAAGFEPWRRVMTVPAGGLGRESVDLVPSEPARPTTAPAPRPAGTPAPETPHREPPAAPATPNRGGLVRVLAWTSSGLALAAGGAALATGLMYRGAVADFEADRCEDPSSVAIQQGCQGVADRRDATGAAAVASGVAAGVFAAGAVVLWVASTSGGSSRGRTATVGCAPVPGWGGACAVQF